MTDQELREQLKKAYVRQHHMAVAATNAEEGYKKVQANYEAARKNVQDLESKLMAFATKPERLLRASELKVGDVIRQRNGNALIDIIDIRPDADGHMRLMFNEVNGWSFIPGSDSIYTGFDYPMWILVERQPIYEESPDDEPLQRFWWIDQSGNVFEEPTGAGDLFNAGCDGPFATRGEALEKRYAKPRISKDDEALIDSLKILLHDYPISDDLTPGDLRNGLKKALSLLDKLTK